MTSPTITPRLTRRQALVGMVAIPAAAVAGAASAAADASEGLPASPGLLDAIRADRAAVRALRSAQKRHRDILAANPDLAKQPSVDLPRRLSIYRDTAQSEATIRARLASYIGKSPTDHEATIASVNAECDAACAELRAKRRAHRAARRSSGLDDTSAALRAGWSRIAETRAAVLQHPCASLADVEAKGRHLLAVVDKRLEGDVMEAFRSLVWSEGGRAA